MTAKFVTSFALIFLGGMCTFLSTQQIYAQPTLANEPDSERPAELISKVRISDQAPKLGFDVKKLESIDRKFTQFVKNEEIVGCSALILREHEDVYFGEWGYQNQRKKIPVDRKTIFRIYSMTKPVVSVAAMQLVEAGKLDLDVPVSQYLPEFADLKVLERKNGKSIEVAPESK